MEEIINSIGTIEEKDVSLQDMKTTEDIKTYSGNIEKLEPNQIFVFGSKLPSMVLTVKSIRLNFGSRRSYALQAYPDISTFAFKVKTKSINFSCWSSV